MSEFNFFNPEEIKPFYTEIVPAYQAAFADEPWHEVSKCEDRQARCVGGLSALAIGTTCDLCGNCTKRPAYEADELVARFEAVASSFPVVWYVEQNERGLTLAAVAWKVTPQVIASKKYQDAPYMQEWLSQTLGPNELIWLDEVFANKLLKDSGNLQNFGSMCAGLVQRLNSQTLAFRTINSAMTRAAKRDFDDKVVVFERYASVPDRRDFVTIKTYKEGEQ